jgi:hypothetical protein
VDFSGTDRSAIAGGSVILVFLLLLVSPLPTLSAALSSPGALVSAATTASYPDYALSLQDTGDRITLSLLNSLTNYQLTVGNFDQVIHQDLLQYNVRQVLLDVGWQNYTAGQVPEESWVSAWLTACDSLGIQNVLYLGPLTEDGVGSTWVKSVISMDPSTRTAFANGTLAEYVSPDNPDVAKFIEADLQTMYGYYASHPSWVGIGTGYPQNSPYYSEGTTVPILGYSNSSVQLFANSAYFSGNTTSIGPGDNGTANLLALSFLTAEPSISVDSGVWMTSSGEQIYGSNSTNHEIEMRFFVPANESELMIGWYGTRSGNPGPLNGTIYPDDNGTISLKAPLGTSLQDPSQVSNITGWQTPLVFHGNFTEGYHWIVFSSPTTNGSDAYTIYMRDYDIGGADSIYLLPVGQGSLIGSTILWIKDTSGQNLTIYPYEEETIPSTLQTFTASKSFSFNTVFLFLSDRDYDPVNGTITVTDVTENDTVVATGILSQQLIHGIQNWTPISLGQNVTTTPGHEYSMSITDTDGGYSWAVVMRGVTADPAIAGFQGQSSYWLFQLGYMKWGPSETNYGVITSNGKDAVTLNELDALRFVPSSDETLNSIQVLMKNLENSAPLYTAGNITVGIWSSDVNGTQPLSPIKSITVPGTAVPTNSWLNVSGFAQAVTGGHYYWLVLSSKSNSTFSLARLTSSYDSLVLASTDGGRSWGVPAEGPTDLSYGLFLSGQTIGNFVQNIPEVEMNQTSQLAQPFTATASVQAKGVYLGVLSKQSTFGPNSGLVVSIHPGNGTDGPSQLVLASGSISGDNITFYSNGYVAFSSVARLQAGQTYWIVVQARSGIYYVNPVVYEVAPPGITKNQSALLSTDNGFSWQKVSNDTTILTYKIASPEVPSPTYSTSQLSGVLSKYYDLPLVQLPLLGWNAYVRSSETSTLSSIDAWLDGATGRQWTLSTSAYPIVTQQLKINNIDLLPLSDNITSCSLLQREFLDYMPLYGTQFMEGGSLPLLSTCSSTSLQSLEQELNRMYYLPAASNSTTSMVKVEANSSSLVYSVRGTVGGPLLVWLSNPTNGTVGVTLSVNESGLSTFENWNTIDAATLSTQQQGVLAQTVVTISPNQWTPVYLEPAKGELTMSYYTAPLLRQFTYPNQGVYDISGATNQTVVTAIASSMPVRSVLLDDQTNLTELSSAGQLLTSTGGWYFDNASDVLLVTYVSHGLDTVRVLQVTPQPSPALLPTRIIEFLVFAFVTIDVGLASYFLVTKRQMRHRSSPVAPEPN